MAWEATQVDLEEAVGGAKRLLQLADFDRTGSINDAGVQARIALWLSIGAGVVRRRSAVKHDPEVLANLDAESARSLTEANAAISGRVAYQKGSSGLAMPEKLGDSAKQADEFLARLAEGKETLGRAANGYRAAINQPTGVVDYDPQGRAVSITGLKGGFR